MIVRRALTGWITLFGMLGFARAEDEVRLNQIQVIGTHNSYHIALHPNVAGMIGARGRAAAEALDYTHRPLAEQFSRLGIRQIELDVFADPEGGRYANPSAREILKKLGRDPGPDPNEGGRLRKPGLKVFHLQDFDYQSTAPTFLDALQQVRAWSADHPQHIPILILVETKESPIPALPTQPAPFGKPELDAIDNEIRSVFRPSEILTPDDVRGSHATLREAILTDGWPTLDRVRGKVFFALDSEGTMRDRYLEGHFALKGRVLFTTVAPEHPAAAWIKVNDPVKDYEEIQKLVRAGFLVRTRADADTAEARANDPSRRDKALSSGAQFISTDFPEPRLDLSPYQVRFSGGVVARPNPVSGRLKGSPIDLESPGKTTAGSIDSPSSGR